MALTPMPALMETAAAAALSRAERGLHKTTLHFALAHAGPKQLQHDASLCPCSYYLLVHS